MLKTVEKVLSYVNIGKREFLLEGPAGTGKTSLTKTVAKKLGAEYIFLQAYPGMRFDELRAEFIPDPSSPSGIGLVKGVLVRAVEKKLGWRCRSRHRRVRQNNRLSGFLLVRFPAKRQNHVPGGVTCCKQRKPRRVPDQQRFHGVL